MRRGLRLSCLIALPLAAFGCTDPNTGEGSGEEGIGSFTTGSTSSEGGSGETGEVTSTTTSESSGDGDGDGDGTSGDGDGDGTSGDGDGDGTSGDGDGDGDGDGTSGDGDGDGTSGDGDGDGTSGDGDGDTGCFNEELSFEPFPPSIVLVLDKSGSMTSTYDHDGMAGTPNVSRWQAVHIGVTDVLNAYDNLVEFGLKLFPSDTSCGVNAGIDVNVAPMNAANILAGMPAATASVSGLTPSGEGLQATLNYLQPLATQGNKAIIFMADGDVSCGTPGTIGEMSTMLANAYNNGGAGSIPTYVVGINASGTTTASLNALAVAGGVPLPGGAPGCDYANTSVPLTAGTHTVTFQYTKDGSVSTGTDSIRVDDLSLDVGGSITFSDGFESGDFSGGTYAQGGTLPWLVDTLSPATGTYSARSGVITHSQTSQMTLTVNLAAAGNLSFNYRTETESCCDDFNVLVDGSQVQTYSGSTASSCPPQFYDSQNTAQFFAALDGIIGNLVTCDLVLDPPPPFPDNIDVNINGMDVMQLDPTAPGFDCATQQGWYYSNTDVVTLCGSVCDDFKALATPSADITYYCSQG